MKSDKLVEIPHSEWMNLRDLYLSDWPTNMVGYYTVDNFIRWVQIDPHVRHLKIYSLNGDWSDGTFLVVDRYQLFLNSLSDSNERLTRALSLLDWSYGYKISSFLERHRPAVLEVVEKRELDKEYDSHTPLYYLPREDAAKMEIECPADYVLRELSEDDAGIADEVWPNRHHGSLFFLKRLADWNANIGVYEKDTGELVAWCFRLQAGCLGALQVKSSHRRRGLGSLAIRAMCRKLVEMDHDVFALVNKDNVASRRTFEKLGFKCTDNCYWLRTFPTIPDYQWTDE